MIGGKYGAEVQFTCRGMVHVWIECIFRSATTAGREVSRNLFISIYHSHYEEVIKILGSLCSAVISFAVNIIRTPAQYRNSFSFPDQCHFTEYLYVIKFYSNGKEIAQVR